VRETFGADARFAGVVDLFVFDKRPLVGAQVAPWLS